MGRKSKYSTQNSIDNNKLWSVAVYIRLSQEDSDNCNDKLESNSITNQRNLLKDFVNNNNDLKVFDTYIDDGFSGTDFNRPGFQRLLQDMRNGNINCIIVKDLSRLGRNYIEVGNYIEQVFPLFDVRFIAINDNVDSFKNPASTNTLLIPFKNLINDEYARDTSIKIRTALQSKKKRGEFTGSFPAYGYIKDITDKHKLVVDKESAEIVKKIFKWKVNDGLGNVAICHKLNDMGVLNPTGYKKKRLNQKYSNSKIKQEDYSWCPSTVRNILKNDIYIGNITQGKRRVKSYKIHKTELVPESEWITVKNMHEAIIDVNLFNKAQTYRKIDTRAENNGTISMWAGILICGDCGRSMHKKCCKNKNGIVYEYYICGTYRKKSYKLCTKHTIKANELEEKVLDAINLNIKNAINFDKLLLEIEKIKKCKIRDVSFNNLKSTKTIELKKIQSLKMGLYEDWKKGYITKEDYLYFKNKYEQEIKNQEKYIVDIEKENEEEKKIHTEKDTWIQNLIKYKKINKLDRQIISEFIDCIEVFEKNKIRIHFKFNNVIDKITLKK